MSTITGEAAGSREPMTTQHISAAHRSSIRVRACRELPMEPHDAFVYRFITRWDFGLAASYYRRDRPLSACTTLDQKRNCQARQGTQNKRTVSSLPGASQQQTDNGRS